MVLEGWFGGASGTGIIGRIWDPEDLHSFGSGVGGPTARESQKIDGNLRICMVGGCGSGGRVAESLKVEQLHTRICEVLGCGVGRQAKPESSKVGRVRMVGWRCGVVGWPCNQRAD